MSAWLWVADYLVIPEKIKWDLCLCGGEVGLCFSMAVGRVGVECWFWSWSWMLIYLFIYFCKRGDRSQTPTAKATRNIVVPSSRLVTRPKID